MQPLWVLGQRSAWCPGEALAVPPDRGHPRPRTRQPWPPDRWPGGGGNGRGSACSSVASPRMKAYGGAKVANPVLSQFLTSLRSGTSDTQRSRGPVVDLRRFRLWCVVHVHPAQEQFINSPIDRSYLQCGSLHQRPQPTGPVARLHHCLHEAHLMLRRQRIVIGPIDSSVIKRLT